MQQGQKTEFKEFLKRNKMISAWTPICYVLAVLVLLIIGLFSNHSALVCTGLKGLDYRYVVIGKEQYNINSFCRFEYLSTVKNEKKHLNSNVYMQLPESEYRNDAPMFANALQADEIAISEKIADKLKVAIGDSIHVDFSVMEEPVSYKVACIFEYADEYYNLDRNGDFSVVLIGYNESLKQSVKSETVSFLNETDNTLFMAANHSYTNLWDVEYEKTEIMSKRILHDCIIGLIWLAISLIFTVYERRSVQMEWQRYHLDGYTSKAIQKYHRLYGIIVLLMPLIVAGTIFTVFFGYVYMWGVFVIVAYLWNWVRYADYEKAV